MTNEEIEKTEIYSEWLNKLLKLNDRINNLKVWNDYAEMLQRDYDFLLEEDPRLEKNKIKV